MFLRNLGAKVSLTTVADLQTPATASNSFAVVGLRCGVLKFRGVSGHDYREVPAKNIRPPLRLDDLLAYGTPNRSPPGQGLPTPLTGVKFLSEDLVVGGCRLNAIQKVKITMTVDGNHAAMLLGLVPPSDILAPDIREEFSRFSQQLETTDGNVVISNPYFFNVELDGIIEPLERWRNNLAAVAKTKLLLLSIFCRPFDPSKVWLHDRPRLIDDPFFQAMWSASNVSLAEGPPGIPWGLDVLQERRRAFTDPGIKHLIDNIGNKSSIETITSEFMGGQPGNFAYQAWQVAEWSRDWAIVYGVSDAGHGEGYPFPWLLGFCRRARLERNFVALLREAASRYDIGFYCTHGHLNGSWRLAKLALTLRNDGDIPDWCLIEEILELNDSILCEILDDGPEAPEEFLSRLEGIMNAAEEAGLAGHSLAVLMEKAGGQSSLAAIERKLPEWKATYDSEEEKRKHERERMLLPFKDLVESFTSRIVGSPPYGQSRIGWAVKKRHVQDYIENHILAYHELPKGLHDLGSTEMYKLKVGSVDFDEITRLTLSAP